MKKLLLTAFFIFSACSTTPHEGALQAETRTPKWKMMEIWVQYYSDSVTRISQSPDLETLKNRAKEAEEVRKAARRDILQWVMSQELSLQQYEEYSLKLKNCESQESLAYSQTVSRLSDLPTQ